MPGGRPSEYTPEMGDKICEGLASGRSLNSMCKGDDFPALCTVYKWMRQNPDFAANYTRAREDQADTLADEIVEIADDKSGDTEIDENGRRRLDQEFVARSRLRVDARKWVASKLKPKRFGDRAGESTDTTVEVRILGGLQDSGDAEP